MGGRSSSETCFYVQRGSVDGWMDARLSYQRGQWMDECNIDLYIFIKCSSLDSTRSTVREGRVMIRRNPMK